MIIEAKEDVVRLEGSLHKNLWETIKATANMQLKVHPEGIIIDCSQLEDISENGAKTFLEATRDIEAANARMIVVGLPKEALAVCKATPGVRSSLPIAESVEAARASLRRLNTPKPAAQNGDPSKRSSVILVPLLPGIDLTYGAHLAGRLAKPGKTEIRLVYLLEVARTQPLNAPMEQEEQQAQETLEQALQYAKQYHLPAWPHIERVRDAIEGVMTSAKTHLADMIVIAAGRDHIDGDGHERFHLLVDTLLQRAPCEVIVGRMRD